MLIKNISKEKNCFEHKLEECQKHWFKHNQKIKRNIIFTNIYNDVTILCCQFKPKLIEILFI